MERDHAGQDHGDDHDHLDVRPADACLDRTADAIDFTPPPLDARRARPGGGVLGTLLRGLRPPGGRR